MDFSKRLKELREKKGLSQEELAEKLDIPRSSVTHYENNAARIPRQNRLNEIADFFGVSVDYLIGRAKSPGLNLNEEKFMKDIMDSKSLEEIKSRNKLTVDGKPATDEEIKAAIAFIRSMRNVE